MFVYLLNFACLLFVYVPGNRFFLVSGESLAHLCNVCVLIFAYGLPKFFGFFLPEFFFEDVAFIATYLSAVSLEEIPERFHEVQQMSLRQTSYRSNRCKLKFTT